MPSKGRDRDHKARWERRKAAQRRTPLNQKFCSKMGKPKDAATGAALCPKCGAKICFDTTNGRLVAFNFVARDLHHHQPQARDPAANRAMVSTEDKTEGYFRTHKGR